MPQQDPIKPGQITSIPQNTYVAGSEGGKVTSDLPYVAPPTAPNLLLDNTAPNGGASNINPAYALYINTLKSNNAKRAFLSTPYYTNAKVAERYSDNEAGGYHPYDMNLENWYGDNQSWLSQWGNRLGKTGTKALGSFANSLMDIPNMINAASQGNLDKMWDNPTNNWATDLMDWSEKNLPNYETNWEREHPFKNLIPIYGNSGNGWGKVVENLGFTLGAVGGAVVEDLAIGALTGGVGEIPVAAMQINKAAYKLGKLINLGDDFLGGLKSSIRNADDIVKGLKGIDRVNYAFRKGLWGANMITSGVGEAAFEGIDSYNNLTKDLQQQFLEENNRMPTYEDNQKIERTTRAAGNTRFLLNAGLLAVTNTIQWGNLLRPLNATKGLIEAEAKQGVRVALQEGSRDVFEAIDKGSKLARWGRSIANSRVGEIVGGSLPESFEEFSQYVIELGVNDYYKRKYDAKNVQTTNSFLASFGRGLAGALGTQQGWENTIYGLLGGAMYKGGEHLYYKARGVDTSTNYKKQVETVIQGLNTNTLSGIFENKYGEAVNAISIQEDLQAAAASGNVFQYQNYKHDQFVNFILSGLAQNKYDTRIEQLQELKKLDKNEFEQTFGIPASDENKKTVNDYVDALQKNADYMKDIHKRVSRTFTNPFIYKGTGTYTNKENKAKQDEVNEKYIVYEEMKNELVRYMSIAKNSADRVVGVTQQISNLQSVVDPRTVVKLASQEGLQDLKKEYKENKDLADSALKLDAKNAKNNRDSKWYGDKIAQIDEIFAEKDDKEADAKYNKFLNDVFDRTQKENNTYYSLFGTPQQMADIHLPFPRDVQKETINLGQDIYHLQKRSELAVDRYAKLTTKGGFKKHFDDIMEIRKKVAELQVTPETPAVQGQAAQQQTAFNAAQAQQGQPITPQPQQQNPAQTQQAGQNTTVPTQNQGAQQGMAGFVEEEVRPIPDDQRVRLNRILVDTADGKMHITEVELGYLGFKSIDDVKFDDPKANIADYKMVKASDTGRNFYIHNDAVEAARKVVNGASQSSAKVNDNVFKEATIGIPLRNYLKKVGMHETLKAWLPLLDKAKIKVIENVKGLPGAKAGAHRVYDKSGNIQSLQLTVEIGSDFSGYNAELQKQIIAHELIHATIDIYKNTETTQKREEFDRKVKVFADRVQNEYNKQKSSLGLTPQEIKELDGFFAADHTIKNAPEEIITYGLTDPAVMKMLKNLKGTSAERSSMWKDLLKFIGDFLGIKQSMYNDLIEFVESEGIHVDPDLVQKETTTEVASQNQSSEQQTPGGPPITPTTPPPTTGEGGLRTGDFMGKIFVPGDLKLLFNNAVFSGTKDQVKQNISVTIRPLAPDWQASYNRQQQTQDYTQIQGFPGVFVARAPIDLSIAHNGIEIGKVAYPKRLLFKVGDNYVTIDRLTPEQYQRFTGKSAALHAADVDEFNKQVAFTNYLALKFRNNGLNQVTLDSREFNDLMDIAITYGELDLVATEPERPSFTNLKYNTVALSTSTGQPLNTMVIFSIPKRFIGDTMTYERTEFMNTIYGQNFYESPNANESVIESYKSANIDALIDVGSRYVGMVSRPDGTLMPVALRPAEMTQANKDQLFLTMKTRSEESARANFVEGTADNKDGVLLVGDREIYFKLPSDAAKSYNDQFNTDLNGRVYLTDINGKNKLTLSISPIGALRLEVFAPEVTVLDPESKQQKRGYRTTIYIAPQVMSGIESFEELVNTINKEIVKKKAKDPAFNSTGVILNSSNFRQNILNDSEVRNAEEIANQTTAATSVEVFKNGTMKLLPNTQAVQSAYNNESRVANQQATPEQTIQGEPVITQPTETPTPEQPTDIGGALSELAQTDEDFSNLGDIFGETPTEATQQTSPQNQEDITQIVFDSVRDALASMDIGYRTVGDATEFYTVSTGEVIDIPGVAPKDLAAEMGLTVREQQKPDTGGFDFMRSNKDSVALNKLINLENARAYIGSILPSFITVKEIDEVIDKLRDQGLENPETSVWGAFKDGVIYLNRRGPNEGVEYHEAFHAVFNMFLSPKEQGDLIAYASDRFYEEQKKLGKSVKDYIQAQKERGVWNNLNTQEAYQAAAEEWLAEAFRKWKVKKNNAGILQKLFDLIDRFFKWLTRSGSELDTLFNKIDMGGYKYSNVSSNSFTQETTDENVTPEFKYMLIPTRTRTIAVGRGSRQIKQNLDSKTSKQVVQNVAAYFEMYKKTGAQKISDDKLLDQILDDLKLTYDPRNARYAGATQEQLNAIANSDENFIYSDENSRSIIKDAAKKYINSMNYFEQFGEDELETEEQDTGSPSTGYDNRSENVGGFSSIPGMLRHYIGFTSYEVTDRFGNTQLEGGKPVVATVDAISVYYGLLRATANITDPVRFFQRMIKFGDNNEQSRYFIQKFIKDTGLNTDALFGENRIEATENKALVEIVRKGFNKFRIDYTFTQYDMRKAKYESYAANRRNVENVQFDSWSNRFIAGYSEMSDADKRSVRITLDNVRNRYFDERRAVIRSAEEQRTIVNEVRDALLGAGIQVSYDYIRYSLLNIAANRYDAANKEAALPFDDPRNTFISNADYNYVQIMKIADEIALTKDFMDELSKTLAANANPYFREIKKRTVVDPDTQESIEVEEQIDTAMVTRLQNIGKGNAFFDETVGESSFTTADNKVVFAHQDGTFNVKASYELRDATFRRQLREQGFREEETAYMDAYDSDWLTDNHLLKSDDFEAVADNLIYQNIDGMRVVETNKQGKVITQEFREQKEGVTYGSYSPREFLLNNLNFYVSGHKIQKTGKGDISTTPHLIRVLEASKTGATVNLPVNLDVYREGTVTEKTIDLLSNEVNKEYKRIQRVQSEIGTKTDNIVENYHTGSFKVDAEGNPTDEVDKGYRGLKFTDNMTSLISKATASILERKARNNEPMSEQDRSTIKQEVKDSLNKMVDDTISLMSREGIIRIGDKGNYQNVLLDLDFFRGNANLNLQAVSKDVHFKTNIGHVLINDYINTLAYNQILHGDSALSLKNDGGIDAVKRAKGDNAAIVSIRTDLIATELGITKPFTHSSVAIFKEPIAVDRTKVADAQMYTTTEGLRYTLWGLGRLSPRLAAFIDALERGDNIHALRTQTGVDEQGAPTYSTPFDGVFDDSNGLLAWDEMTNSLKLVFKDGKTYFKMSVVVLQPNLTATKNEDGTWTTIPGWETLDNLRRKMEADGIHFSAPESASKMMTLDVSKAKDFSDLKGHLFDNQYFGLQTENPSNKLEITTPTQLLQLIDSEQDDSVEVYIGNAKTTVGAVRATYQDAVSQKATNSYEVARNEIYDIEDFNQDVDRLIEEGKVSPRLNKFYQRVSSTLEASGADAQLLEFFSLDANGNVKFNANISAIKTKSQQLYLAYFTKGVMSQKNPGYTVALFSGINTKTIRRAVRIENGQVVQWEHVRKDQYVSNHRGVKDQQILQSKDQVTEVGQVFLDELQHNVPEYDKEGNITGYYSEMILPAHFKELLSLRPGDDIPEAISKMFGVRIPSQDKHSFISLKLVDFLPANLGSTGMFAKELIKLSGADFDIDKLFITRYDFYTNTNKNGITEFKKYGSATNDAGKWSEYKRWMLENNKSVKNTVRDILTTDQTYQDLKDEQTILRELQMEDAFEDAAKQLKKALYDRAVSQAFNQLKLPSTLEQFVEVSRARELNNGILNNRILDSYIALQTNQGIQAIAATPATLTALDNIQKENDITLRDAQGNVIGSVFEKKTNYPVDSPIGKYFGFKNNTTGKNNIGIDVNANLIYSVANKGDISLLNSEDGFEFDDVRFSSFAGSKEYNLETGRFDGKRTNDVLSTLITAATDEAKEQLNALYNLGVDALKVVNYLVGLKVPLKTAIYLVNQPSIRNYLDIKGVRQNTVQTKEEEDLFKRGNVVFREEAVARTKKQIKDYKDLSDDDMFSLLESNGIIEVQC